MSEHDIRMQNEFLIRERLELKMQLDELIKNRITMLKKANEWYSKYEAEKAKAEKLYALIESYTEADCEACASCHLKEEANRMIEAKKEGK